MTNTVNDYQMPEFSVTLRTKGMPMSKRVKITSSRDIERFCREIFNADQIEWVETFVLICLNRAYKPLGFYKVSQGGVSGTVADPKVIFQIALAANASTIIVAHNHPSGNLTPSAADVTLTKRLVEGGKLLEVQVLDHLIMGAEGYYSLADEGVI
jgi:DNA repair protein RadC